MPDPAPPRAGDWQGAREHARAQVREIFGAGERACASCGARVAPRGRFCPECGAAFVARRTKRLRTRRARVVAVVVVAFGLGVAGGVVALLAPGINHSKRLSAAAQARTDHAATAGLIAAERAAQVLHAGRGAGGDPGAGAPPAVRVRVRSGLVARLRTLIVADARTRVRARTLTGPVIGVRCSGYPPGVPPPETKLTSSVGAYACVAVNRLVRDQHGAVIAVFGDPFWARIDFGSARMAWCKVTPLPGEGGAGTGPPPVPLAPACNLEAEFRGVVP